MAQEIITELGALDIEYQAIQSKYYELREKREKLQEKLKVEELKNIKELLPFYERKLQRLKKYTDAFMAENVRSGNVQYAFQKVEGYIDDYHNPTNDPLNWKLSEYDLLEMSQHLEILFEYSNESVRDFVEKWMTENVFYAGRTSREGMFTLKLDRL